MKNSTKILFFLIFVMLASCSARKVERERRVSKTDSITTIDKRVEVETDRTMKEMTISVEVADTTKPIVFDDGINPPVTIHNVKKVVLGDKKVEEKIIEKAEEKVVVEVRKEEKTDVKKTDKKAFPFLKVGLVMAFVALIIEIILMTRKKFMT